VSQKVKVCRASGMPVKFESIELYRKEFQALYDKVMVRFGLDSETPRMLTEDESKRIQYLLERCDKRLLKKYPNMEEWPIPADANQWADLVAQHGPIMVAKTEDTGETSLVIFDINL
jgi:hypothetical protein